MELTTIGRLGAEHIAESAAPIAQIRFHVERFGVNPKCEEADKSTAWYDEEIPIDINQEYDGEIVPIVFRGELAAHNALLIYARLEWF